MTLLATDFRIFISFCSLVGHGNRERLPESNRGNRYSDPVGISERKFKGKKFQSEVWSGLIRLSALDGKTVGLHSLSLTRRGWRLDPVPNI
jgi:hypothetical protein